MAIEVKRDHDAITLLASAQRSVTPEGGSVSDSVRLAYQVNAFVFTLDVTATETTAGDWLYVTVQTLLDGTHWTDVARFATVVGDDGTARRVIKHNAQVATAEFEVGTALGAGAVRNHHGDEWRVKWEISKGCSPSAKFTFSVTALPM